MLTHNYADRSAWRHVSVSAQLFETIAVLCITPSVNAYLVPYLYN